MQIANQSNTSRRHHLIGALVAMAALVLAQAIGSVAYAEVPDEFRVMAAVNKFDETSLVAVTYHTRGVDWLRANRTDWSFGLFLRRGHVKPFVVIAPVWRVGRTAGWFVDFSIGPTLLSDPGLGNETLGGNLHFTSALSVGRRISSRWQLSLRAQHISNAGLHDRNPGFDSIGLSIARVPQ